MHALEAYQIRLMPAARAASATCEEAGRRREEAEGGGEGGGGSRGGGVRRRVRREEGGLLCRGEGRRCFGRGETCPALLWEEFRAAAALQGVGSAAHVEADRGRGKG